MFIHQAVFLMHVTFSTMQDKSKASGSALIMRVPPAPKPDASAVTLKKPDNTSGMQGNLYIRPHPGPRRMHRAPVEGNPHENK